MLLLHCFYYAHCRVILRNRRRNYPSLGRTRSILRAFISVSTDRLWGPPSWATPKGPSLPYRRPDPQLCPIPHGPGGNSSPGRAGRPFVAIWPQALQGELPQGFLVTLITNRPAPPL